MVAAQKQRRRTNMNQTKSSNEKTSIGIMSAMRPLWRVGIPATAALSTALAVVFAVALDGCSSNKGNKTNVTSSSHTSLPSSSGPGTSAATLPDLSNQPVTTAKKSKPVVQRLSTVGYADGTYGVSFRYPRNYTLLTPEKVKLDQSLEQVPMNFVQPGGVSLATIGWANGPTMSLFNVSVNKGLNEQQCQQFAVPDASDVAGNSPVDTDDDSLPVKVSLHGTDFTRVENGTEQNDIRYYHHFENGACYEFVMAVEESQGNTKPVDHFALFDKMERIMATVKIKPEPVPALTANVPSASTSGSNPR
jgi:hypothetical protein